MEMKKKIVLTLADKWGNLKEVTCELLKKDKDGFIQFGYYSPTKPLEYTYRFMSYAATGYNFAKFELIPTSEHTMPVFYAEMGEDMR